ncbi:MAG TPA: type II toxin-antitoxin system VapC family toxin [Micromonosporaceae bacterium]|nr:type II toxin-antitoxin system VapC family toxin [Micromonosporaceae bacterium]
MIVIDASAMVEALVGRNADDKLLDALQTSLHAPHLLDVEVLSVLRGLTLGGKLAPDAAEQARTDYFALTIARYELSGLADRVWGLRHSYTAYDASCLALAEALDVPLYTCDRKLASDAHGAKILVLARTR